MFVSMVAGAVFVVIFGIIMMLVLYAGNLDTLLMVSPAIIIVRMAKATKWLQAILDYMKKVKSITSTVFGQFS